VCILVAIHGIDFANAASLTARTISTATSQGEACGLASGAVLGDNANRLLFLPSFLTVMYPGNEFTLMHYNGTADIMVANGRSNSQGGAYFDGGCVQVQNTATSAVALPWSSLPCSCSSMVTADTVAEAPCHIHIPAYYDTARSAYAPAAEVICTGKFTFALA